MLIFDSIRTVLFSLLALSLCPAAQGKSKVFLLEDDAHQQWCAFHSETEWTRSVEKTEAQTVASVEFENGSIVHIDLTETDETGDWIVYDVYFLNTVGLVTSLQRTTNLATNDLSIRELYLIRDRHARIQSTAYRSLRTGRAVPPNKSWRPKRAVKVRINEFAFAELLKLVIQEPDRKEPRCARTSRSVP